MIDLPPDPTNADAKALADEITKRQLTVRWGQGIAFSALNSTVKERRWLSEFRSAERRMLREQREAERAARRPR